MHKSKLFRVLAAIVMALGPAGCSAIGDFIATEAYDVAMTNVDRVARWELVIVGGHHDPYTYVLSPGQIRNDTIHVQSRWNSGTYGPTNNQYRYADVRVSAKNLATGQAYGPVPAQLHWPGVTGIRVGGGPPAIQSADPNDPTKTILVTLPPNGLPSGGVAVRPPAEDPNQGGLH